MTKNDKLRNNHNNSIIKIFWYSINTDNKNGVPIIEFLSHHKPDLVKGQRYDTIKLIFEQETKVEPPQSHLKDKYQIEEIFKIEYIEIILTSFRVIDYESGSDQNTTTHKYIILAQEIKIKTISHLEEST